MGRVEDNDEQKVEGKKNDGVQATLQQRPSLLVLVCLISYLQKYKFISRYGVYITINPS